MHENELPKEINSKRLGKRKCKEIQFIGRGIECFKWDRDIFLCNEYT